MILPKFALAKGSFFDRPAVVKAMDAKTRKTLSRFGAFVRQTAQKSIRSAKKSTDISRPGSPPLSHVGILKKLIFFSYDAAKRSVVIGPVPFTNKLGNSGAQVLEEGGTVTATTKNGITTVMVYRARPYMQPAFQREIKKGVHLEGFKK